MEPKINRKELGKQLRDATNPENAAVESENAAVESENAAVGFGNEAVNS